MGLKIRRIQTELLDIPIKRPHQFSTEKIDQKGFVLVRLDLSSDIQGIGEGTTPGIWWNGESVETMKLVIDQYIAPLLVGEDPRYIDQLLQKLDRHIRQNSFAKAAVEMALYDALGKYYQVPVHQLLGGACHRSLNVRWALASGTVQGDIEEGKQLVDQGHYQVFKIKSGKEAPEDDVERSINIAHGLSGTSTIGIDPNGSWSRLIAKTSMEELNEAGIDFLEQPLPPEDYEGLSELVDMKKVPIMADESVCSIYDAYHLAQLKGADIFSLKIHKFGGMHKTLKVGAVAESSGISCFGGTSLESSIGTAACLQVFSCIRSLDYGTEIFGPDWLADDIVTKPLRPANSKLYLPDEPGLGVELKEEKVKQYRRQNEASWYSTTKPS
ncbi:muconate/chloromuconate family cycloisomerase [Aquisalibacillus elongatus]|uniref:Muconate cycloisomerase n=1 Tax=Aquisalibacillus elongatus TaxID=485577 RepID=A0A3N5C6P4_9BACI|nr:muconate/chloromuconate family cycloisomerase [Aquisalibacillus elongatus]RPF52091.1 muconate cycloisomerase [Aquisalibacillus elongatus]